MTAKYRITNFGGSTNGYTVEEFRGRKRFGGGWHYLARFGSVFEAEQYIKTLASARPFYEEYTACGGKIVGLI